jgi:hypothetical protein
MDDGGGLAAGASRGEEERRIEEKEKRGKRKRMNEQNERNEALR